MADTWRTRRRMADTRTRCHGGEAPGAARAYRLFLSEKPQLHQHGPQTVFKHEITFAPALSTNKNGCHGKSPSTCTMPLRGVSSEYNSLVTVFVLQEERVSNCQAQQTTLRGVVCGVVCSVGRGVACSDWWCCIMCGEWCGLQYGAMCCVASQCKVLGGVRNGAWWV